MSKASRYLEMVTSRKSCQRCERLINPSRCQSGNFDSDEIGPWTLWQGNLEAQLMIVAQDWGDTTYFLKNKGRETHNNPTNLALAKLLESIGIDIGQPSDSKPDRGEIFLTNAVLCLKEGGLQAAVEKNWFTNCASAFLKPAIELVGPKALIALGERAYHAIVDSYDLKRQKFRDEVESKEGRELSDEVRLFAMYHCGRRIQNTHRKFEQQLKDWQRVKIWLNSHASA